MSNKTKEILDRLKYIVFNEIIDYGEELSLSECKLLLDYITNLQEEIRRKDNIIYDLEDFIKEIMKATNKEIINIETAEIIYNKLKDLQGKSDE